MNLDQAAGEARAALEALNATVAATRADQSLSTQGKRGRIATAYAATTATVDGLRAQVTKARDDQLAGLRRQLFRPAYPLGATTADKIAIDASFRDGLDRAGTAPECDLGDVMRRALLTGDGIQARAALALALERRDVDVLNAYIDEHPSIEPAVQQFVDATTPRTARDEIREVMATGNAFYVPVPTELEGWSGELDTLVNGNAA